MLCARNGHAGTPGRLDPQRRVKAARRRNAPPASFARTDSVHRADDRRQRGVDAGAVLGVDH
jgi:hypothetical protein